VRDFSVAQNAAGRIAAAQNLQRLLKDAGDAAAELRDEQRVALAAAGSGTVGARETERAVADLDAKVARFDRLHACVTVIMGKDEGGNDVVRDAALSAEVKALSGPGHAVVPDVDLPTAMDPVTGAIIPRHATRHAVRDAQIKAAAAASSSACGGSGSGSGGGAGAMEM
jgi:hypothetical protein